MNEMLYSFGYFGYVSACLLSIFCIYLGILIYRRKMMCGLIDLCRRIFKREEEPVRIEEVKEESSEMSRIRARGDLGLFPVCASHAGLREVRLAEEMEEQVNQVEPPKNCECANCEAIQTICECNICLLPLQGQEIEQCMICANFICRTCILRLTSCAFCRSKIFTRRNRAIERVFDMLELPCRNMRYGCTVLMTGDDRRSHERLCMYTRIQCPFRKHRDCQWTGSVAEILDHLEEPHKLIPVMDNKVDVYINNFTKAFTSKGREYTACLCCFSQIFVMQLTLSQENMRFVLTHLGAKDPSAYNTRQVDYYATVSLACQKQFRKILDFKKTDFKVKRLDLSREFFLTDKFFSSDVIKITVQVLEE